MTYLLLWRPNWETISLREPPTRLMSVVNHVRKEYLCVESSEIDSAFKKSHRVFSDPIFTQIFKDFWLKHLSICQNLPQNLLEICTSQDPHVGMSHGFPRSEDFLPCSVALVHSIRSNTVHEVMTNPMQKNQQMSRGKKTDVVIWMCRQCILLYILRRSVSFASCKGYAVRVILVRMNCLCDLCVIHATYTLPGVQRCPNLCTDVRSTNPTSMIL